ncbi:C4-dicarboxylate ABC transporter [Stutzerimonas stutzeri]|uniref:C4-dicarboxylate ABC transporter n=1 Tax=Stutzerimonas stutzeri TaxID=316 RepID=W8QZ56_STUST|nr:TRAP transporter substrate-binding protein [Stutzerimonas stutzeri]AHL75920.1 C4-dicarboxylate ABC transporter [Stutzerimonas stutzeri]MCQ4331293.1 TRAP transporter substrate-binding protein [Stutzerimonas stutzeri]
MLKLPKLLLSMFTLGSLMANGAAQADESVVTLKLAHFLPAHSVTQAQFLEPWAQRITQQSNGRIQFQFYPSMQLGGTPPQLVDQVRDGVADIVWTLPGYSSGRFPLTAAFELPFMSSSSEASSQAMWDFIQKHGQDEFADMHLLATHLTDGALVHTTKKPIHTLKDFRGQKLRAANRTAAKTIGLLGATPVAMPVPQVPEALSKGVVDGAVLPWDVVPALKLHELVKYHTETAAGTPALMHTALIVGMNKDTYNKLPADLKQVIDANSGRELSREAGRIWDNQVVETGHKLAQSRNNEIYVLPPEEQTKWMETTSQVSEDWIKDVESKGYENGKALLDEARQLIEQYNAKLPR